MGKINPVVTPKDTAMQRAKKKNPLLSFVLTVCIYMEVPIKCSIKMAIASKMKLKMCYLGPQINFA